jgi:isochorismate hydrolase
MSQIKTTTPQASDEKVRELLNANIDTKFVKEKAQEHFTYLMQHANNFAIVSIDMQSFFLRYVSSLYGKKVKILVEYHKELKRLSRLNNINFIEVEYSDKGDNVLKDNTSIQFAKSKPYIDNKDFYKFIQENNIEHLFVIGIFRNACVMESIAEVFIHVDEVYTSLIGVATSQTYLFIIKKFNQQQYSLQFFLKLMKKMNVHILDYDDSRLGFRL